jgi:hypothetical protein
MARILTDYFPAEKYNVHVIDDLQEIRDYLDSKAVTYWAQGALGDSGYYKLVLAAPRHNGDKSLIIVATVENVERARAAMNLGGVRPSEVKADPQNRARDKDSASACVTLHNRD